VIIAMLQDRNINVIPKIRDGSGQQRPCGVTHVFYTLAPSLRQCSGWIRGHLQGFVSPTWARPALCGQTTPFLFPSLFCTYSCPDLRLGDFRTARSNFLTQPPQPLLHFENHRERTVRTWHRLQAGGKANSLNSTNRL
jgi:hypothetical protein